VDVTQSMAYPTKEHSLKECSFENASETALK